MKKVISIIVLSVFGVLGVIAQDTLNIFEVADTSLAVAKDIIGSAPASGSGWKEFVLWGISVLALAIGLINYFKGKKIV
ncbi:MAG: hypothetical protein AABY07_06565 [Nanoarchaeota archaeon]